MRKENLFTPDSYYRILLFYRSAGKTHQPLGHISYPSDGIRCHLNSRFTGMWRVPEMRRENFDPFYHWSPCCWKALDSNLQLKIRNISTGSIRGALYLPFVPTNVAEDFPWFRPAAPSVSWRGPSNAFAPSVGWEGGAQVNDSPRIVGLYQMKPCLLYGRYKCVYIYIEYGGYRWL